MSTTGAATATTATTGASSYGGGASSARTAGVELCGGRGRGARGEKKAGSGRGRGRRRRGAGEQHLDDDGEDDFSLVASRLGGYGRRGFSSANRREREQYFEGLEGDVVDPDVALAVAISVAERSFASRGERLPASVMTYESLTQLEDVRCVASASVVAALPVCSFVGEGEEEEEKGEARGSEVSSQAAELRMCVICQSEYDHGDSQLRLPCLHMFHQACAAEWLLKYSKLCPICKLDVS